MEHRIYAKDYTEEEILKKEPGPWLDFLAWQGISDPVLTTEFGRECWMIKHSEKATAPRMTFFVSEKEPVYYSPRSTDRVCGGEWSTGAVPTWAYYWENLSKAIRSWGEKRHANVYVTLYFDNHGPCAREWKPGWLANIHVQVSGGGPTLLNIRAPKSGKASNVVAHVGALFAHHRQKLEGVED